MGARIVESKGLTEVDAAGYTSPDSRRLDEPEPLVGRFAVSVYPGSSSDVVIDLKRWRKVSPSEGGGGIYVRQAAVSLTRDDAQSLMDGLARALGLQVDR